MQINQTGRSMIEMLGVLSIIGVLTVGGLTVIAKARRQQSITQTVSEISQLVESSKKIACQYDSGYGDFVNYLYRSEAYPNGLDFTYANNGSSFTLSGDVTIKMPHKDAKPSGNGEERFPHFIMEISDMNEDTCVNLASSNWGSGETNGYIGATFNKDDDYANMATNYPRMDPGTAAAGCKEDGTTKLYLGFRICK